ncbi:MAG: hypothetical protein KIS94_04970 [Chitinophagales bacterium]|nr:hypothetical protein [Chitinophagales bacterium]
MRKRMYEGLKSKNKSVQKFHFSSNKINSIQSVDFVENDCFVNTKM